MSVLIIAEAGVNHNGDIDLALQLVRAAAAAGADMVKFQTFSANEIATEKTEKADYQKERTDPAQSQLAMISNLQLSRKDHEVLFCACSKSDIKFFSTGFDINSLEMLIDIGIDRIKIPSGEITNLPLIRYISKKNLPVILSTGMSTMGEIEKAIEILEDGGLLRKKITVLHCNTQYPTPMIDVNLLAMNNIGKALGVSVGYSDHTLGIELPIAAVALGATVIEKHLTLDRNLPGPDHAASLEPEEFSHMVKSIRNIELALQGDGIKRPSPSETKNRFVARRSLVALRAIKAGELFTPENLTAKRPGTGISPMRWDEVIGRPAPRDFAADELIKL